MFFKDIANWDKKKLFIISLIFNGIYLLCSLIIPIIIVGCRYQLFAKVSNYRLTGWGWIIAITVSVVGVRTLGKVIRKLPESTLNQQRLKYTILGLKALAIPILLLVAMYLLKSDFDLAYQTLWWCLISYSAAIVVDYTCIMYLDREADLRKKAYELNEVNKRVNNIKE